VRGGNLAYLMELMVAPEEKAGARALIAEVTLDALARGAAGVYAVATARQAHRATLKQLGFLPFTTAGSQLLSRSASA
jgi:hypothetical protein